MKTFSRILAWFITIFVPFALTFLGLRLLLTPAFPQVEYRTPGFPADEYGFTLQDRLHWSTISIDYLVNNADISFLGNLTFPDGSPLFNERELSHMHDVKQVVKPVLWIGYTIWILLVGFGSVGAVWRLVAGISTRPATRRLAHARVGGCARQLRCYQLLAVLHDFP